MTVSTTQTRTAVGGVPSELLMTRGEVDDLEEVRKSKIAEYEREVTKLCNDTPEHRSEIGGTGADVSREESKDKIKRLKREITRIDQILAVARIIPEGNGSDRVIIGSKVTVEFLNGGLIGKHVTSTITSGGNLRVGTINQHCPMAAAILGMSVGDEVEYSIEGGKAIRIASKKVRIIKIE